MTGGVRTAIRSARRDTCPGEGPDLLRRGRDLGRDPASGRACGLRRPSSRSTRIVRRRSSKSPTTGSWATSSTSCPRSRRRFARPAPLRHERRDGRRPLPSSSSSRWRPGSLLLQRQPPRLVFSGSAVPADRTDVAAVRIGNLLRIGIGQSKILRDPGGRGAMHAAVFWGFIVLTLRHRRAAGAGRVAAILMQAFVLERPLYVPYVDVAGSVRRLRAGRCRVAVLPAAHPRSPSGSAATRSSRWMRSSSCR